MGDAGSHLHTRPLAAQCEAGTDGQQTADEFDRDQPERRLGQLAVQHGFDVGYAAAGGVRRKPAHKPGRNSGRTGTGRGHEQKSDKAQAVGPRDQRVAQVIGALQSHTEDGPDEPRRRADDEREDRQHHQPVAVGWLVFLFRFSDSGCGGHDVEVLPPQVCSP
jgi:hypothetical protein